MWLKLSCWSHSLRFSSSGIKGFLLNALLTVFGFGKRFLLDALLWVFVNFFGQGFLLNSLLRVFVFGGRFVLDSLLEVFGVA